MSWNPGSQADEAFALLDEQIAFVLNHPGMSDWLKRTLAAALDCPPTEVMNDLEILSRLIRLRSELLLASAYPASSSSPAPAGSRTLQARTGPIANRLGPSLTNSTS
ncbi:hypothetical protein [Brevundimonas sp.]